ncbi:beta-L-arabinofuranosidase domain-containing protein [Oleiharenicola sp. Vm1]|uniref:beta-L-arabinofuranosidase domain-containing protein n=1 Tax=Oleiharenicola sp. Vm1 TaxID=3398393 RepID=UPI0039F58991
MPHLSSSFRRARRAVGPWLLLLGAAAGLRAEPDNAVEFVATPPVDRRNTHYISNRAPLAPTPLVPLPLRAIRPGGWLRQQLELQADGFHGHFAEISKFLKKEKNAWLDLRGEGDHGWEEVPYWLKGFAHNAYLLGRQDQIAEAQAWFEGVFAGQQPDGWFGPRKAKPSVRSVREGERDLWPNMIMLFALQSYYDYSDDVRVLELMRRYARWQMDYLRSRPERGATRPETPYWNWQQQRAGDALWNVYWLYNRTGDESLLALAREIFAWSADWTSGLASAHNVNVAQSFDTAAIFWQQSHDPRHLASAERNWTSVRAEYGQVPGGMFGADEQFRPGFTGPRQAVETCGIVEEMLSDEQLLQVTGDPRWADRAENVAFNSFPASMTADLRGVRYLTAPNQPLSDGASKAPGIRNAGAMFLMSPSRYRCCQHNFGHGWPYLASSLWFATGDDGVAAVFYGESEVTARVGARGTETRITAQTHYPFDETVRLKLSPAEATRFPLYLRVPEWCRDPQLTVNGRTIGIRRTPGPGFVRLERTWRAGDAVELTLPMRLQLRRWEKNGGSVSVDRGPLTFSLQIKEDYRRAGGSEAWPSWEIWPASPWNFGLVLAPGDETRSFAVETRPWPADDRPFTQAGAPIVLHARGRRIREWGLDSRGLIDEVQRSPAFTPEPAVPITLIPMGAARLRISAFPVAGDKPEAHAWIKPSAAPAASAKN